VHEHALRIVSCCRIGRGDVEGEEIPRTAFARGAVGRPVRKVGRRNRLSASRPGEKRRLAACGTASRSNNSCLATEKIVRVGADRQRERRGATTVKPRFLTGTRAA